MTAVTLSEVPLFAELAPDRLAALARDSTVSVLAPGAIAALRGQPATALLVVESGGLRAVHESGEGRRLRLGDFRAPCAVDKVALLDTGAYTSTWEAIDRTRIRSIPRAVFLSVLDDVDAVRRHVLAHLAAEVRRHQEERVTMTLADATARVAAWLVAEMAVQGARVELVGGQEGLGESIGASRVTTNRCLQQLADLAVIRVERRAVCVLAPELLARIAVAPI